MTLDYSPQERKAKFIELLARGFLRFCRRFSAPLLDRSEVLKALLIEMGPAERKKPRKGPTRDYGVAYSASQSFFDDDPAQMGGFDSGCRTQKISFTVSAPALRRALKPL